MDKIILGLLMIKAMTGYEIRNNIKNHFSLMCSDSAGSIQIAIQKLLSSNMISHKEYVEKGVNKKLYSITEKGKNTFFIWEEQPMNSNKSKNIELAKLYFLGTLEDEKRERLLRAYIQRVSDDWKMLVDLKEGILKTVAEQSKESLESNKNADLFKYQMATLEYGIALFDFEIQWYRQLLNRIEENESI